MGPARKPALNLIGLINNMNPLNYCRIVTLVFSCLIEMAKRVANILRVVLSLQQGGEGTPDPRHIPLCQLALHIGRLPMPEDYALEELRSLTQSYLQEYVISH